MKKLMLSAISLFACGYVMAMSPEDLKIARAAIEDVAKTFGKRRANPISYDGHWKRAFIAYAFDELKQGANPMSVLGVAGYAPSNFIGLVPSEPVVPYFLKACSEWETLTASMENDWQEICVIYSKSCNHEADWQKICKAYLLDCEKMDCEKKKGNL